MDHLNGSARQTSWTDPFSIFEALASSESDESLVLTQQMYCQTPDLGQGLDFDFTFAMEQ